MNKTSVNQLKLLSGGIELKVAIARQVEKVQKLYRKEAQRQARAAAQKVQKSSPDTA